MPICELIPIGLAKNSDHCLTFAIYRAPISQVRHEKDLSAVASSSRYVSLIPSFGA
jgi:hypothetical protein